MSASLASFALVSDDNISVKATYVFDNDGKLLTVKSEPN
jgi:hypothetical protein